MTDPTAAVPSIQQMIRQLKAAGWTEVRATLWRCPFGWHYRGPYNAWQVMRAMQKRQEPQP